MSNHEEKERTPEAIRARLEDRLVDVFHDKRILFEEGRLRFHAKAVLECDEWGVTVRLEPEIDQEPFTVSGAWEILSVWANRLGAAYVGWGISVLPKDD
jgi:hypothetical protein